MRYETLRWDYCWSARGWKQKPGQRWGPVSNTLLWNLPTATLSVIHNSPLSTELWKSPLEKEKKRDTTMTDNFNYATAEELVTVTMCLNAKHRAPQRTQNALTEILKLYNTGIQKPHCPPQYNKKPSFFSLQSHWNSIFGSTFFLMKKNTLPSVLQWWPTWQGAGFPGRDHSVENKRIVMQIVLISCRFSPTSLQGFYSSDNAALQVAQKQNLRYILKSI